MPNTIIKHYFLNIFCLLVCLSHLNESNAQIKNIGIPAIRNYSIEEYGQHPQNWAILQDKRGIMYFANTSGVLEFDGTNWTLIELPSETPVRSFCKGDNGRIYVGGQGEFGFLETDSLKTGKMVFKSMLKDFPEKHREFEDVWNINKTKEGIMAETYEKIFYIKKDTIEVITSKTYFHTVFYINEKYYVREQGVGMQVFVDGKLKLIPDGEIFANKRVYVMLPFDNERNLLITRTQGMFIYDGKHIKKWENPINKFLIKNQIYTGKRIANKKNPEKTDYFILGTLLNGIIIIDKEGKPILQINKKTGLQNNTVFALKIDMQNNLWLALSNGISYIELNSPYSYYGENTGLPKKILGTTLFDNNIYVCTGQGLFWKKWSKFENPLTNAKQFSFIEKTEGQTWENFIIDNQMYCAHNPGILQIKGNKATTIALPEINVWTIQELKHKPGKILVGVSQNLYLFEKGKGTIKQKHKIKGINTLCRYLLEDKYGQVWLSHPRNGVFQLKFNERLDSVVQTKAYGIAQGLPEIVNNKIALIGEELCVSAKDSLFIYNKEKDCFESYKEINAQLRHKDNFIFFEQDSQDQLWFKDKEEIGVIKPKENYRLEYQPFLKVYDEDIYRISTTKNSGIFFETFRKSLIHYDPDFDFENDIKFKSYIRKVVFLKTDSVLFGGTFTNEKHEILDKQPDDEIIKIEYKNNSLRFVYSSSYYEDANKNMYSFMLEGFDKDWSAWTSETKKEYTNIPPGKYVFKVKTKNIYRVESDAASYRFTVLPPWYMTGYAYFFYVVSMIGLYYLGMRLNSRRLKKKNAHLEDLIKMRTSEILNQNEEILAQRDELKDKNDRIANQNEQIKGSIRYAYTIQKAILPIKTNMDKVFDSFVIYLPKDIVSGDFYWYFKDVKAKRFFIAAVDCTGHGVPGAFMTMLGYRLLNEITTLDRICEPDDILQKLDEGIRISLKQDETANDDGMDACLCVVNPEFVDNQHIFHVSFCGAKRPLFYYHIGDSELGSLPASRKSIGGIRRKRSKGVFKTINIDLYANDIIYLSTDGIIDQPSPARKRFGTRRMLEILNQNKDKNLAEQQEALETALYRHQLDEEQRDDITLFGVRLINNYDLSK